MGNNKNNMKKIKRALISVWNKNNLDNLLNCLKKNKIEIISSGGTYKKIKNLGFKCIEVSNLLVPQKFLVVELKHYIQKFMLEF